MLVISPFLYSGELGSVYRTPCVVFTGHPSLRCGDAVHFMEEWGSGTENAVMFTGKLEEMCHMTIVYIILVVIIITRTGI